MCGSIVWRREAYIELTLEVFLDTAATSHWTQILVALKTCGWVFTMTLALRRVATVSWPPKEAQGALPWPITKEALPWDTLTSSWKRQGYNDMGKRGRARHDNPTFLTEEVVIVQGPEDTKRHKRCHEGVCLLNLVLTFKTTEEDPGGGSPSRLLWDACYRGRTLAICAPSPVTHWHRALGDMLHTLYIRIQQSTVTRGPFSFIKNALFLWNSLP